MSSEERPVLALQTGAKTGRSLTKIDCILADVLRAKGEMSTFLFRAAGFGRTKQYAEMTDEQIVDIAIELARR